MSDHLDGVFQLKDEIWMGTAREQKPQAVSTLQQAAKPHLHLNHHSYMPGYLVQVLQSVGEKIWDASISGHFGSPGMASCSYTSADEDYRRQKKFSEG